jgi:ABC-type proline/glycine betaine transport system permease subunit
VRQVGGAAIVPLSISGIPYFGRVSEAALREVDRGLVEAVRAMGGGNWAIIREALVPEALPSLIAGFTVTLVLLVGASAMAGAVGAGGLGDLAIRYGYQRFETSVMVAVIVVLIAGRAHSGWRRPFGEAGRFTGKCPGRPFLVGFRTPRDLVVGLSEPLRRSQR